MKYFTPSLIERLGSDDDDTATSAAAEWEEAVTRHQERFDFLRQKMPVELWSLWDRYYLHDAEVLSMGMDGKSFVAVLRLDVPPRELLVLNYLLEEDPLINTTALPAEQCTALVGTHGSAHAGGMRMPPCSCA